MTRTIQDSANYQHSGISFELHVLTPAAKENGKEEKWIIELAKNNGFQTEQIQKLIRKITEEIKNKKDNTRQKSIGSFPYIPNITKTIKRICKKEDKDIGIKV